MKREHRESIIIFQSNDGVQKWTCVNKGGEPDEPGFGLRSPCYSQ